jgi:hypothetical protein
MMRRNLEIARLPEMSRRGVEELLMAETNGSVSFDPSGEMVVSPCFRYLTISTVCADGQIPAAIAPRTESHSSQEIKKDVPPESTGEYLARVHQRETQAPPSISFATTAVMPPQHDLNLDPRTRVNAKVMDLEEQERLWGGPEPIEGHAPSHLAERTRELRKQTRNIKTEEERNRERKEYESKGPAPDVTGWTYGEASKVIDPAAGGNG